MSCHGVMGVPCHVTVLWEYRVMKQYYGSAMSCDGVMELPCHVMVLWEYRVM